MPATPQIDDKCNTEPSPYGDNAKWIVPANTDEVTWQLSSNGGLSATAADGHVFANGQTVINFGLPADSGELCPPPGDKEIPVPAAPQPIDPCNAVGVTYNASWPVPVSTAEVTWSLSNGELTATANTGYVFADGTKVKNFGVAPDSGVVCPPTSVPVPAAPQPIDPCNVVGGGNNAYWPVPASTAEVTWSLTGAGELIATANAGYVFADGRTSINFGIAPDNGVVCPPVQVPVPAQPSHIEVCDTPGVTNNSIWVVPANTAQVTWTLLANGQLVSRTAAGYVFTNGSTEINWGIAPDNGWSCVPGTA